MDDIYTPPRFPQGTPSFRPGIPEQAPPLRAPISMTPHPTEPGLSSPLMRSAAPAPRKSKRWIWLTAVVVVAGGILGGGYYAYSHGFLAIPFLTPKTDELFTKMVENITNIKNAQYTLRVDLKSETKDAQTVPLFENKNANSNGNTNANTNSTVSFNLLGKEVHLSSTNDSATSLSIESIGPGMGLGIAEANSNNNQNSNSNTSNLNANSGINANRSTNTELGTPFSIESIGGDIGLGESDLSSGLVGLGTSTFGNDYLDAILEIASNDSIFKLSPDTNLSGSITTYLEADKATRDADGMFSLDGSYSGGDSTASLGFEIRKINQDFYGVVKKFPTLWFDFIAAQVGYDISSIKEKWIKVAAGEQDWLTDEALDEVNIKAAAENLKRIVKNVLEAKVFSVKQKLGSQVIAGTNSEHYLIEIDPTKLTDLYDRLISDERGKNANTRAFEDAKKALDEDENMAVLKRFAQNSRIEIWVDRSNGYLRQISWSVALVPNEPTEKMRGKQFVLSTTLTLDKVNQEINVPVPASAIDMDEAERLVTGVKIEDQKFKKQRSRTNDLRSALRNYYTMTSTYPTSIANLDQQLRTAQAECKQKKATNSNSNVNVNSSLQNIYTDYYDPPSSSNCYEYYSFKTPFNITDVYTGKDYVYAKTQDDYSLKYEMRLAGLSVSTYYKDYYVEGTNTMVSDDVSVQKESSDDKYNKDTDKDGLKDYQEETYQTDKTKADTDGDGLNDYEEVFKYRSNPKLSDSDKDGTDDSTEVKNGTNPNLNENLQNTNRSSSYLQNSNVNAAVNVPADTDGDGVSDYYETSFYYTNPTSKDTDKDGISDYAEIYACRTSALKADTDNDSYADKTEIEGGYNPNGSGSRDSSYCKSIMSDRPAQ